MPPFRFSERGATVKCRLVSCRLLRVGDSQLALSCGLLSTTTARYCVRFSGLTEPKSPSGWRDRPYPEAWRPDGKQGASFRESTRVRRPTSSTSTGQSPQCVRPVAELCRPCAYPKRVSIQLDITPAREGRDRMGGGQSEFLEGSHGFRPGAQLKYPLNLH